jgi:hypothetical protein
MMRIVLASSNTDAAPEIKSVRLRAVVTLWRPKRGRNSGPPKALLVGREYKAIILIKAREAKT